MSSLQLHTCSCDSVGGRVQALGELRGISTREEDGPSFVQTLQSTRVRPSGREWVGGGCTSPVCRLLSTSYCVSCLSTLPVQPHELTISSLFLRVTSCLEWKDVHQRGARAIVQLPLPRSPSPYDGTVVMISR
ncbi:hypothetical protein K466DRAFT_305136 [Polyporus arcularius HHB13444]|uniref:Uncharacterized protein n=1 Tax=Polyporus arcularius HHB13444 TaxID=1314778 RepID=A0A5C3NYJ6_9APHY|nr:hypothetical protein K466DRAFT_305136 [Polyporus arcularius HHB13444]